jgi:hypothetical protein
VERLLCAPPARNCTGSVANDLQRSPSHVTDAEVNATLHFVIPTGAYPDFLPRSAGHGRVCGFP